MNRRPLLFEIGTEELPAGFLPGALEALEDLARRGLEAARLAHGPVRTLGTPRRLALFVDGLAEAQADLEERLTGPPAAAAFDGKGRPTRAAEGFARKHGVDVSALSVEETDRGAYVVLDRRVPGRPALEVLPGILAGLVTALPFPKTMRWGAHDLRFARPIRWLVALFGDDVVPLALAGVRSGRESRGHRFAAPGPVAVAADLEAYRTALADRFVTADPADRRARVREAAEAAAAARGGRLLPDPELIDLNADLTEYPVAVCGDFDRRFLELPRPVLVTAMREHQKYFAVVDEAGDLLPHFVAVNNTPSPRPELVTRGHERVLRARLADAAFFFEEDRRRPLEAYVPGLADVVFHAPLGSMLDKTRRVEALARFVARRLDPAAEAGAARAARLAKADLLTEMVGEFPTLQGIMGREYALLSGETPEVADAIREHYLPVRAGGELPAGAAGAAVALADKADTVCATFAIGLQPSGTADPYGLRRLALGVIRILEDRSPPLRLDELVDAALAGLPEGLGADLDAVRREVLDFFRARLVHELAGRGHPADTVEAAVRCGFEDPADCRRRVEALEAVRGRPEFAPLGTAFKRVMNILKDFQGGGLDPERLAEPAERSLHEALSGMEAEVRQRFHDRDYEAGLVRLLDLKPHVDRFFDEVMVMAEDPAVRRNRLALLRRIADLFLAVGDLSAMAAG
ncbi:glycine--tRNA ligase subunit beta [Dissulfurirhabdus thermomarina]|uniref:Glycine--tRNA ligase beta subunit n=1 Tax=Dissulfurirhabdus thermomarina TaxID=1765737 RepID=A0A6N9TP79_DISTH|nr:glycine--tRNA ligase subunit beta [Dissulfurirhabdus thermomarina]NDY43082.1 glycine--tRNA ligase subunit beta [Dissulfurirhabdus thermomarina]NMX24360.1 glycine--tRNA ligase subunit beta [Dissulfurirhabdus thermomarina]